MATNNICIIPARGGSKRIPRKNIRIFCGKPMMAWSIEAAKTSGCFDHIVVSTDDAEIADVAQTYGAEVPFLRPVELSDDYTGTTEVVAHAVQWARDSGWTMDAVCCLYATAPLVRAADLQAGLQRLRDGGWAFFLRPRTLRPRFSGPSGKTRMVASKCSFRSISRRAPKTCRRLFMIRPNPTGVALVLG